MNIYKVKQFGVPYLIEINLKEPPKRVNPPL